MIFTEIQLDRLSGVSYEISTAENGGNIWNDRSYKFSNLPSYLVGALLFQVPHKSIPKGTIIQITLHNPSTIYIAHEEDTLHNRSGGFQNSLTNSGWTLENNNAQISTGCCTFKYVWKKFVPANGPTSITLPETTTSETVHSIFVKGNSFNINLNY